MVRNYEKQNVFQHYDKDNMIKAIDSVNNETATLLSASHIYSVPYSTLRRKVLGTSNNSPVNFNLGNYKKTFTEKQEEELVTIERFFPKSFPEKLCKYYIIIA